MERGDVLEVGDRRGFELPPQLAERPYDVFAWLLTVAALAAVLSSAAGPFAGSGGSIATRIVNFAGGLFPSAIVLMAAGAHRVRSEHDVRTPPENIGLGLLAAGALVLVLAGGFSVVAYLHIVHVPELAGPMRLQERLAATGIPLACMLLGAASLVVIRRVRMAAPPMRIADARDEFLTTLGGPIATFVALATAALVFEAIHRAWRISDGATNHASIAAFFLASSSIGIGALATVALAALARHDTGEDAIAPFDVRRVIGIATAVLAVAAAAWMAFKAVVTASGTVVFYSGGAWGRIANVGQAVSSAALALGALWVASQFRPFGDEPRDAVARSAAPSAIVGVCLALADLGVAVGSDLAIFISRPAPISIADRVASRQGVAWMTTALALAAAVALVARLRAAPRDGTALFGLAVAVIVAIESLVLSVWGVIHLVTVHTSSSWWERSLRTLRVDSIAYDVAGVLLAIATLLVAAYATRAGRDRELDRAPAAA